MLKNTEEGRMLLVERLEYYDERIFQENTIFDELN
jgi:hypothetical protein